MILDFPLLFAPTNAVRSETGKATPVESNDLKFFMDNLDIFI